MNGETTEHEVEVEGEIIDVTCTPLSDQVSFRTLCEKLGLNFEAQLRRLRQTNVVPTYLTLRRARDKKLREITTIDLNDVPKWIDSIDTFQLQKKVKERLARNRERLVPTVKAYLLSKGVRTPATTVAHAAAPLVPVHPPQDQSTEVLGSVLRAIYEELVHMRQRADTREQDQAKIKALETALAALQASTQVATKSSSDAVYYARDTRAEHAEQLTDLSTALSRERAARVAAEQKLDVVEKELTQVKAGQVGTKQIALDAQRTALDAQRATAALEARHGKTAVTAAKAYEWNEARELKKQNRRIHEALGDDGAAGAVTS